MGLTVGVHLGTEVATTAVYASTVTATASNDARTTFEKTLTALKLKAGPKIPVETQTQAAAMLDSKEGEVAVAASAKGAILSLVTEAAAGGVAAAFPHMYIYADDTDVKVMSTPNFYIALGFFGEELMQFIKDYFAIHAIFKEAMKNSGKSVLDTIGILKEIENRFGKVNEYLEKNSAVLVKYTSPEPIELLHNCVPLIAGIVSLNRLANDVDKMTRQKQPITDAHMDSFVRGVDRVITACKPLAWYMAWKKTAWKMSGKNKSGLFPRFIKPKHVLNWEIILSKKY